MGIKFRIQAFITHLAGSATVLGLALGTLYIGWYHWPGWYLSGVTPVIGVMAGVDLALGPLLTLVIANPRKPRRELRRDIGVIIAIQLAALSYGTLQMWNGRPLYYVFSDNALSLVQAYDIEPQELALAEQQQAPWRPHWYSLPRWVAAPAPAGYKRSDGDLIAMPRYYQSWQSGLPALRRQLVTIEESGFYTPPEKTRVEARMRAAGFSPQTANALPLTGRHRPLVAVFDPHSLALLALISAT
jgi:hypothetical protein